jgi:hypothetical protein
MEMPSFGNCSNNLFELQNKNSGLVTEALQFKPKVCWSYAD